MNTLITSLPEKLRQLAHDRREPDWHQDSDNGELRTAFNWTATREGHNFWCFLNEHNFKEAYKSLPEDQKPTYKALYGHELGLLSTIDKVYQNPAKIKAEAKWVDLNKGMFIAGMDPYITSRPRTPDEAIKPDEGEPKEDTKRGKALRYNGGKPRHELLPNRALEALVDVYTRGAHKYTVYEDEQGREVKGSEIPFEDLPNRKLKVISDGADNWKLGQNWKGSMASVKRHIAAWEKGEDFDPDPAMGTYHLANAAWGLFSLLEYYSIYPQGDDRDHAYMKLPKIGLDIDEVLCDWVGDWTEMRGISKKPTSWWFDRGLLEEFEKMKKEEKLDEFYLSLRPLIKPEEIPFEPHCYITSRPVDTKVTEEWLAKHGFPARPVFTTGVSGSKVEIAKREGVEVFVDDGFHNFKALNEAGITCYLMDAPHNKRYEVGHKRIKNLKELI